MATTQGAPITLALVVAAPLCWGVIAAKPPRFALLQLSEMRPAHRLVLPVFDAKKLAIGGKKVLFRGKHLQGHFFDFGWRADGCRQGIKREGMDGGFFAALDG